MIEYWNRKTVAFMADAAEYCSFHRDLAEIILPYLPGEGNVCEAGCGLGYLSRELANFCKQVTAADCSRDAIDHLLSRPLPENLKVCCTDAFHLDEAFDAMVFCYFGRMEDILRIAKRACKGTVVAAKRNCAAHRFSLSRENAALHRDEAGELLTKKGIPFEKKSVALEFGQPFRTVEDAVSFFQLYDRTGVPVTREAVEPRLQAIDHPIFSWYLPSLREMNLYVFEAKEIPGAEEKSEN